MSRAREKKLRRIADLAKDALDVQVGKLAEARRVEEERTRALATAREQVVLGIGERDAAMKRGLSSDEWGGVEAWIATLRKREVAAAQARERAAAEVVVAREGVIEAQSKLRRIEAVIERVLKADAIIATRVERTMEDEFAAQSARARADLRGR